MFSIRQSLLSILLMCLAACVFGCRQQDSPPATETREFAVEGMSCEGCVNTVTSALKAVPGVKSVEVSLKDKPPWWPTRCLRRQSKTRLPKPGTRPT